MCCSVRQTRALHDSVVAAELRFFYEWGRLWRQSEDARGERLVDTSNKVTTAAAGRGRGGAAGATTGSRIVPLTSVPYNVRTDSTRPRNQHLHCHPGARFAPRLMQDPYFKAGEVHTKFLEKEGAGLLKTPE